MKTFRAVVCLALGGCSGAWAGPTEDPGPAPPYIAPEPCSLVTQAEVETALGAGATMTQTVNPRLGYKECKLTPGSAKIRPDDDQWRQIAKVHAERVIVVRETDNDQWRRMKDALPDNKPEPGVGDDAFSRGGTLHVRKGRSWMQIFDFTEHTADEKKANRYLAERAASRLPAFK